jgi:hypothetical protein
VSRYVGPAFDELVGKCLRAAPEERYPNAAALCDELRAFCRAGGLDDDEKCLRRFLADPDEFEAELGPRLAQRAVATARKHARRGEFARALAELSRATEYDPKNTEAGRLIASISSRRRWLKVGGAVAGGLALAGAVAFGAPEVMRQWRREVPPPPPAPVVAIERPATPAAPPAETPPPPAPPPPAVAPTPARGGDRPKSRPPRPKAAVAVAATASAVPPAPPPEPAPPAAAELAVTTPPVVAAPRPKLVTVRLTASHAFCDPSLDGRPSGLSPITYPGVEPGEHQVFCRMPSGEKVALGAVQVPARESGEHTIQIVPNKGTPRRPMLASGAAATRPRQPDPGPEEKPATPDPGTK